MRNQSLSFIHANYYFIYMENLLLPSKVEFKEGGAPNMGSVVIMPCYHGYGTTLGNAYRRVLLSSLPGAAVEAFKIKGSQHEFSTIEGIKEDVVEIILNLKQLSVKVYSDEPITLNLSKKGPGAATAADIEANSNVEIINKDLVIANIVNNKTLEMEIIVGRGRGFKPAEEKDRGNYGLGTIVIDSAYSPVRDIGYDVEYTRVGDITNFERLSINIETDGTISPKEAISQANQILMDHFNLVGEAAAVENAPILDMETATATEEAKLDEGESLGVEVEKKTAKKPRKKAKSKS